MEVVQCEREIQSIKAALRQVSSEDETKPNSLEVIWTGLEGMEVDDSFEIALQLSSPVEELSIPKCSESATFAGVESSMATLTVTLKKDGQVLGTSEALDMSPVCSLGDALNPKESYVTPMPVAIVAPEGEEAPKKEDEEKPAQDETKEDGEEKPSEEEKEEASDDKKEEAADKKEASSSGLIKPLCTVALKMVFKPSGKDIKEALYELLNKASLRKSQAVDRHQKEQRSAMTAASSSNSPDKKPAIKAGFLNKKAKKDEESKLLQFYNKWLGPKSLGRVIFPIAKNYVIFFGAIIMMHFKGQELSLPAPV